MRSSTVLVAICLSRKQVVHSSLFVIAFEWAQTNFPESSFNCTQPRVVRLPTASNLVFSVRVLTRVAGFTELGSERILELPLTTAMQ